MVDRLEELLELLEEESENQQEKELAVLTDRTVPAAVLQEEGQGDFSPAGAQRRQSGAAGDREKTEEQASSLLPEELEGPVSMDAPEWPEAQAPPQETAGAWSGPERVAETARAALEAEAQRRSAETGQILASTVRRELDRGLEGLYRQTAQASRPAPALQKQNPEQAGRTALASEPGNTAALTVDELDRAVRRDSRRYDGGMSIF